LSNGPKEYQTFTSSSPLPNLTCLPLFFVSETEIAINYIAKGQRFDISKIQAAIDQLKIMEFTKWSSTGED